jgi:DNA replication protein DnaC
MKEPKNMLVFHGTPGIGKTYFCAALTDWMISKFDTYRYHTEEEVLRRLREGIAEGKGDYLIGLEYLIDDDFVMLDDVGSGINPDKVTYRDLEFRREVFFSFLDYRYNCQKPTIITSNFTKAQFGEVYSERILSRLFAAENTIISLFDPTKDKRALGM